MLLTGFDGYDILLLLNKMMKFDDLLTRFRIYAINDIAKVNGSRRGLSEQLIELNR